MFGKYFKLIQCNTCNLITLYPKPSLSQLYKSYYQSYRSSSTGQRFSLPLDRFMKIWRNLRAARMSRLSGKGPILDVGCGQAIELQILKSKGINIQGLEYDKQYANSIAAQTNITIHSGKLTNIKKPVRGFTLISFLHSLEHIPEALSYLKIATKLLHKKGYLMISLPNFASFESQVFKQFWFHLDIPRHLYHFTQNWLIDYLDSLGFRCIGKKYIAPEYDFYSLLQSGLNRLFPKQPNLLYRILLREQKKSLHDYKSIIPQVPVIILLSLFSLLITPVFWLMGGSGTVELIFRKRT